MNHLKRAIPLGFLAGALSVLIFHQGTVFLLHHLAGLMPTPGFSFRPVPPYGVPQLFSLMFWGGIWGIVIALCLRLLPVPDLLFGFLFGAIVCSAFGWYVVTAMKGLPPFDGLWVFDRMWRALLLNGAFGWGTVFLMRPMSIRG
ncbi:hypothetical protein C8P66_104148 [Humitalea rosea]|uniref:Uncharacterized protein n=1 Tax=Humitalea rosea TaxID=990373 RepID=A0A2W7IN49_9PROT|nr:hypothetical protein [Humitalea rosea]PZW48731.1 hypothetical protein C8P66_104148 [Humitalea rosea]